MSLKYFYATFIDTLALQRNMFGSISDNYGLPTNELDPFDGTTKCR